MTKLWEQKEDRLREEAIVRELVKRRLLMEPTREPGARSVFDYRSGASGVQFDIKVRNFPKEAFPTTLLSKSKWEVAVQAVAEGKAPVLRPWVFVHFTDGLYVMSIPVDCEHGEGRRHDRPGEQAPCVKIPNAKAGMIWKGDPLGLYR